MTTTGELRAIIEDLELVDIGDAASYLGEEANVAGESSFSETMVSFSERVGKFSLDDSNSYYVRV